MVVVEKGSIHEIQQLSLEDWDYLVEQHGLGDADIPPEEAVGSGINPVIFVVIGIVVIGVLYFGFRKLQAKRVPS